MNQYATQSVNQLELLEGGIEMKKQSAKRVNIVSLKLVKESSVLYKQRRITSPEDAFTLLKEFLVDSDRERFVVVCLDTKNQPTSINICHVGSLNASLVHPREVMKAAVISNAASIIVAHNHPSQDPTRGTRGQVPRPSPFARKGSDNGKTGGEISLLVFPFCIIKFICRNAEIFLKVN